ncbi:hypothetical protein FRIG_03675 [Frigoribacterium faeni]|uniref:AbiTii domain-containing protein n=1 Tax=Frigoribacterium faeni TaxID=145483 RepID=UPI001FADA0DF|nr:hypothetical protein [Frigoribacterium faeni]MCJ0700240.1 hypothetical protein [Frigoribacterium faeni]
MTNTLLQSLRERALDENETLAGLLRKCLLLGAETGSSSLRDWARLELNGYDEEASVPEYRRLAGAHMTMDSISGNTWMTGQTVSRSQIPTAAREYAPELIFLTQPVEEIERLAQEKSLHFKPGGLAVAQSMWNQELGPFRSIINLSYVVSGSVFAGLVGQIRTKLIDLIADMTMATPLTELPRREDVDAAMLQRIGHVGDVYSTTLVNSRGPSAIGRNANASSGLNVDEALLLLTAVQQTAESESNDTAEIMDALADLKKALNDPHAEAGDIVKRAGKLRTIAEKIGSTAVSSATNAAVKTLTELALQGTFG